MTAITQPRTGITQNDYDICTPQEELIRPKWSDMEERESVGYRQSWDSLAMPDDTQPGRSTSLKDRDTCAQREELQRPHTTCRDSRKQADSGHSWDSLAMPANAKPRTVTSQKDRNICTQREDTRRTQTTCRDSREYASHDSREQVGSGHSWDSLAVPTNIQPGTTASRKDRNICTQREETHEGHRRPVETAENMQHMPAKNRLDQDIAGIA